MIEVRAVPARLGETSGGRAEKDPRSTRAPRRSADPSSWSPGHHRLAVRYERHGHLFVAFLTLAAALIRSKKLSRIST